MAHIQRDKIEQNVSFPVKSTCPYCGVGCGVLVDKMPDGNITVSGDSEHPANHGKLCSKGSNLAETLALDDRLLTPKIRGAIVSWDSALTEVANNFSHAIQEYGPDAVAMYVSGQILTEDYYVANKFMKGFVGSANIDTNSRLCMASTVAGQKRAFGSDTVPNCYEDLELADVIIIVGSNLAWCHPILFQRIEEEKARRPSLKLICIDPRHTATTQASDHHLPIKPGTDVALFNGLLGYIYEHGYIDDAYVSEHVDGLFEAIMAARHLRMQDIADISAIQEADLEEFYQIFCQNDRVVTIFSQGVNQSTSGTDKVNAILNCHLATGRIGKEGGGPFSVTGQPNAMGGREVGGLANQLACHMDLERADHRDLVSRYWKSDNIATQEGLKAIDLFKAIDAGKIKALWIMATNPVDSMPNANFVKQAIIKCPFVVVSDMTEKTDTALCADVVLPSATWGEKTGTVTNSERLISLQKAFNDFPGNVKPDWWQVCEVAKLMGYGDYFNYQGPFEIFTEYAALSAFENKGTRDFNIGGLARISKEDYYNFTPVQWPQTADQENNKTEQKRFFADGGFFTENKKAKALPINYRAPVSTLSTTYPLVLNTGRIRDQWHTMTRTAKAVRLMSHYGEPFVEINTIDAKKYQINDASIVKVTSKYGSVMMRARITDSIAEGAIFAPMHWTDQLASRARIDSVVSDHADPFSGQPESKYTAVKISPVKARTYGLVLTRTKPDISALRKWLTKSDSYWALMPVPDGWLLECAGNNLLESDQSNLGAMLGFDLQTYETHYEILDPEIGSFRRAYFQDNQLKGLIFFGPEPIKASRVHIRDQLSNEFVTPRQRLGLLYGRPPPDVPDKGPIVCSCFNVGANEIITAIKEQNCTSVKKVGKCTSAGTNCGSCKSEISKLIEKQIPSIAAE